MDGIFVCLSHMPMNSLEDRDSALLKPELKFLIKVDPKYLNLSHFNGSNYLN